MFRAVATEPAENDEFEFYFDGSPVPAREGDSVASALLRSGVLELRNNWKSGRPRGPFCMMGACFECLISDDGKSVQACMTTATPDLVLKKIDDSIGRDDGF